MKEIPYQNGKIIKILREKIYTNKNYANPAHGDKAVIGKKYRNEQEERRLYKSEKEQETLECRLINRARSRTTQNTF